MKILLTGTTGYIAKRLLPVLLEDGHEVICCVRDIKRFDNSKYSKSKVHVIEVDFLNPDSLNKIPKDIDVAYYLIHSMSAPNSDFETLEKESAQNFVTSIQKTNAAQVIYLSGIINDQNLSKHLSSRKAVEEVLSSGSFHLTTLRAGIIVGSGSASFEIIRDLVEKLPIMITPKWLNTKSQPIAIRNVIEYLTGVLGNKQAFDKSFDIGGPDVLTYKEMLLQFAKIRKLKRRIFIIPIMTPKLSSYWLYFVTSTSYKLAINLVNSMKVEVVCKDQEIKEVLEIQLLTYKEAIQLAFDKIAQKEVLSSWTDALSSDTLENGISEHIEVPTFGCFRDKRMAHVKDEQIAIDKIWQIGGKVGWYYGNWLWTIRGFIDKLFGGVGLRRGRRSVNEIRAGESLDFWRVLYANKSQMRLLLYAEMKLPGEAWLEIENEILYQTATFRPLGLWGRVYWYSVLPFHAFIFQGLINKLSK
ncbi:MAG: DUF2867 domain-containing protein [Salinivirgaceae bacterium]|nr:DUF2867 domain-containing protein [Salinivirgaceae bacterium]